MKIVSFVFKYVSKCLPDIIRLAFCCVILYLASMLIPVITGKYIDGLMNADNPAAIWICVGVLAVIWTLQQVFSYISNMAMTKAGSRISFFIEEEVIEHVKRLPLFFFYENEGTYIGHRIVSDSGIVAQFVLSSVANLTMDILSLLVSLAAICYLSPYVFFIIIAASPLYALAYFKFRKPMYELSYEYREKENRFFSKVNRQFSHIKTVKQHVYYERLHDEMQKSYEKLYSAAIRNARFGYLFGNVEAFLQYIITIAVFVFSGYGILNGKMSIGDFTVINSYSLIAISALSGILGFGKNYRGALVSYDRINNLYGLKTEHNGSADPGRIESIQIEALSFKFDDRTLINKLNLTMTKGHIYGFVGENGSGKTTLTDLITGIIDGYAGKIKYNDLDLRDIDIYQLRRKRIAIVEQEPSLAINSIDEICAEFGEDTSSRKWLEQLGVSGLKDRLEELEPDAEFTTSVFSGGEKQKISLARAFAKDADVIILDEPSSAIDSNSFEQLVYIIKQLVQDKIIILITHEPRLIAICSDTVRL